MQDKTIYLIFLLAQVAQSVEQRTENPRVGGSIPPLGTITLGFFLHSSVVSVFYYTFCDTSVTQQKSFF